MCAEQTSHPRLRLFQSLSPLSIVPLLYENRSVGETEVWGHRNDIGVTGIGIQRAMISLLLLPVYSLLLVSLSVSLRCSICRHMGLSMVPPNARNSRFIFNAQTRNCQEEEIQCSADEDFCLSAYTRAPQGRYWVQKGCVAAFTDKGGLGLGCSKQKLDLSQARHLPVKIPDRPLELTVCVCNTEDYCNAGLLSASPAAPFRLNTLLIFSTISLTVFL